MHASVLHIQTDKKFEVPVTQEMSTVEWLNNWIITWLISLIYRSLTFSDIDKAAV